MTKHLIMLNSMGLITAQSLSSVLISDLLDGEGRHEKHIQQKDGAAHGVDKDKHGGYHLHGR